MSRMSNRNFTLLVVGVVGLFLTVLMAFNMKMLPFQGEANNVAELKEIAQENAKDEHVFVAEQSDTPPRPDMVNVGGIWRPKADVQELKRRDDSEEDEQPRLSIGTTPFLEPDANSNVLSVVEAIRDKKHPERLTIFQRGKPFDLAEFEKNPEPYLNTIEPGRVFQPAEPGPDVKPIRRKGTGFVRVIQGETATLRVQAEPLSPISFHSAKLGQFSNGLNSITVQANEQGVAEVQYLASGGTYQDVEILAASPLNSGQADFLVYVDLPKTIQKVKRAQ